MQHPAPGASPGAFPHSAVSPAASARHGSSCSRTVAIHRAAFTLVELLLVIGIIGLLAAISVPVVMQSLAKARNAAIKAEIDMLHMAIMNYKNEYGSFPPSVSVPGAPSVAANHIRRIFPRTVNLASQVGDSVNPENALFGWLSGYTTDPTRPVMGSSEDIDYDLVLDPGEDTNGNMILDPLPRSKLFDFDQARVTATGQYHPSGKSGSPYIYIDRSQYGAIVGGISNNPITVGSNVWRAEPQSATTFFNPDTFQILCAGRDEVFGTDDDLSNFWPDTRREYLDSIKN